MLNLYQKISSLSDKPFEAILNLRLKKQKEDSTRIQERQGISTLARPLSKLIWIHAASVGEAQSALILIEHISRELPNARFLVTTGTTTSAKIMSERLPNHAFHQYYPLDYPVWVQNFLNHWQPDLILWMESELWPNMLLAIQERKIPAIPINARLSDVSYNFWNIFAGSAKKIIQTFALILTQTKEDQTKFQHLQALKVVTTDNLKFSAAPLPINPEDAIALQQTVGKRPAWVFASTHDGEELLACKIHAALLNKFPTLLTIIVPRHPSRREDITKIMEASKIPYILRGAEKKLPQDTTGIYIADTLGELGLFYAACDIALIGRSFSNDGGGGHNPIEAAQLGCAVLTGPNIQFQKKLFQEMFDSNAAYQMIDKAELLHALKTLFENDQVKTEAIEKAKNFAIKKSGVIYSVIQELKPFIQILQETTSYATKNT